MEDGSLWIMRIRALTHQFKPEHFLPALSQPSLTLSLPANTPILGVFPVAAENEFSSVQKGAKTNKGKVKLKRDQVACDILKTSCSAIQRISQIYVFIYCSGALLPYPKS